MKLRSTGKLEKRNGEAAAPFFFSFVFASPLISEVRETTTGFHEVGATPCSMPPQGEPVHHPCLLIQWRARTKNASSDVLFHFLF